MFRWRGVDEEGVSWDGTYDGHTPLELVNERAAAGWQSLDVFDDRGVAVGGFHAPVSQLVECSVCGAHAQGSKWKPWGWSIEPHTSARNGWTDCHGYRYVTHLPVDQAEAG